MKIVITAGGTSERIDDVRTITNSSTGSLGYAIGQAFLRQADAGIVEKVWYLHGLRAKVPEHEAVVDVPITGVLDLQDPVLMSIEDGDLRGPDVADARQLHNVVGLIADLQRRVIAPDADGLPRAVVGCAGGAEPAA